MSKNKLNIKLINEFKKYDDKIKISGYDNIPKEGVNIYISNHRCIMDVFLLSYAIRTKSIILVSANSLFGNDEERKNKLNNLLYTFPLEPRAGLHYTDVCMEYVEKLIENDHDIVVFAQGVFDENNQVARARTGIIRMIFNVLMNSDLKINIIPVAINIDNIDENTRKTCEVWDNMSASVTFLPVFDYRKYFEKIKILQDVSDRNDIFHEIMDEIMKQIATCLKMDFVAEYKKLYDMEGLYFPNGQFIKFEDSQNEELYKEYREQIDSIYKRLV